MLATPNRYYKWFDKREFYKKYGLLLFNKDCCVCTARTEILQKL